MEKVRSYLKRIILGLPIASIIGASFLPLRAMGQQLLILFALLWYMVFILFDVLGK
jgi:hypothetical protein